MAKVKVARAPKAPRVSARQVKLLARQETLLAHERRLWAEGAALLAGLDEAGAGPLAGPVTAACVVLDPAQLERLLGVDDSKKLSPERRAALAAAIRGTAKAWAVAEASVEEIDRLNIRQAGLLAMKRALDEVTAQLGPVDHLLVDARQVPGTAVPQLELIKGDAQSLSIAAASILAKVARDEVMVAAGAEYPAFGFERHKGYGTADHLAALAAHGLTPLHRRSFAPVGNRERQLSLLD